MEITKNKEILEITGKVFDFAFNTKSTNKGHMLGGLLYGLSHPDGKSPREIYLKWRRDYPKFDVKSKRNKRFLKDLEKDLLNFFPEPNIEDLKNDLFQNLEKTSKHSYKELGQILSAHEASLVKSKNALSLAKNESEKLLDRKSGYLIGLTSVLEKQISALQAKDETLNKKINDMSKNSKGDKIIIETYKEQKQELQEKLLSVLKKGKEMHDDTILEKNHKLIIKDVDQIKEEIDSKFRELNKSEQNFSESDDMIKKCSGKLAIQIGDFIKEREKAYGGPQEQIDYINNGKGKLLQDLKSRLSFNQESDKPKEISNIIEKWKKDNKESLGEKLHEGRSDLNIGSKFGFKTSSEKFIDSLEKKAKHIDELINPTIKVVDVENLKNLSI